MTKPVIVKTTIGPNSTTAYFAHVDGKMLVGKNGVGRSFRSEEAAIKAAEKYIQQVSA